MTADDLRKIRDAIHVCLMVREEEKLTEEVARERANNITAQLQFMVDDIVTAALKDAARGEVVTGTIGAQPSEPHPMMGSGPTTGAAPHPEFAHCVHGKEAWRNCNDCQIGTVTLCHCRDSEPIGVVRAPRQNPGDGETADEHARRVIK